MQKLRIGFNAFRQLNNEKVLKNKTRLNAERDDDIMSYYQVRSFNNIKIDDTHETIKEIKFDDSINETLKNEEFEKTTDLSNKSKSGSFVTTKKEDYYDENRIRNRSNSNREESYFSKDASIKTQNFKPDIPRKNGFFGIPVLELLTYGFLGFYIFMLVILIKESSKQ